VGQATFRLPHPDNGASLGEAETDEGDFVLIRLSSVRDADLAELSEQERRDQRQRLSLLRGNMELDAFIDALREQTRVRLYTERL